MYKFGLEFKIDVIFQFQDNFEILNIKLKFTFYQFFSYRNRFNTISKKKRLKSFQQ